MYKSYQEAKIANPESDIFHLNNVEFARSDVPVRAGNWEKCCVDDYCIGLNAYRDSGGDVTNVSLFVDSFGYVYTQDVVKSTTISDLYVLMVSPPIPPPNEVEWVNGLPPTGVECEWIGGGLNHGEWGSVIVHAYHNDFAWIEKLRDNSMHTVGNPAHFRKLETQEDREKREELEAAYDIYVHVCKETSSRGNIATFEQFNKGMMTSCREEYLAIIRKTGYRKGGE